MVASPWTAWVGRVVAAIWRPGWSVPRESIDLGLQRFVGRSVRHLGVASSFRALDHIDWGWPVGSSRHSLDSCVPAAFERGQDRESADYRSVQEATEGDHPFGLAAYGATGTVLHLYSLHLCLCRRHPAYVPQPDLERGSGRVLRFVRQHTAIRTYVRPYWTQENLPDRRCGDRPVRVPVFRNGGHCHPFGSVHRDCPVADPTRHAIWAAGCIDSRSIYAAAALQRFLARLSVGISYSGWTSPPSSPPRCSPP